MLEEKSVLEIGSNAFDRSQNLTVITIPEGVTSIGAYAFEACPKLTKVVIPSSVVTMGIGVFSDSSLVTIYGVTGSYAQTYANANKIKFVDESAPVFGIKSFTATPLTGQYLNTAVQLKGECENGKTSYQYKFSYTLNGVTTLVKNFSTAGTASFTPTKAGTYTLILEVKDGSGATASQSIEYTVVANPTVGSFITDQPSGQTKGEKITLTAEGSGGIAPYTYRFYSKLGTVSTVLKDYNVEGNTATFIPAVAGSYTLCVDVKDAGGKIATRTITGYTIVNPVSVKTLTTDKASGQGVETAIKLTATGVDGTVPYEYEFFYTIDGTTTPIQTYTTVNSATFTPDKIGSYTLGVTIRDKNGKTAEKKIVGYEIVERPSLSSFTVSPETTQYLNTGIQLTATGTGGKGPYQYQFSSTLNGIKTVLKAYSSIDKATFNPTKAGVYTLTVEVKDANGNIGTSSINPYTVVVNPTVGSFGADKLSGQITGTAIELSAEGSGGMAPYTYRFYTKLGTVTTTLKDYNVDGSTAIFTPDKIGSYTLCVDIKDKNGKIATKSITGYSIVNPLTVKTFTTSKLTGQAIGSSILLTATGSNGKSPYKYQFFAQREGEAETMLKDYTTIASATFKPLTAGNYTLKVNIKDNAGNIATREIENYKITPDPVVTGLSIDTPNGPGVNTAIQLTATAGTDGKTPYQYQFYYKLGTAKVTIRAFATTNTATFKPTKAGNYEVYVDIKDANGRIANSNPEPLIVYASPTVASLTASKVSGQYVGTDIGLTAVGTGGTKEYTYSFYYKLGTGTEKVSIPGDANSATTTFAPTEAGIYTLGVDIKDANGVIATKSLANYKIVNKPKVKNFITSKLSSQPKNTNIILTAMGKEGKTPYQYKFTYKNEANPDAAPIIIRDFSSINTATFKPTVAGTYTLTVEVRDAGKEVSSQTITGFVIN
jgi:hypothetical protein